MREIKYRCYLKDSALDGLNKAHFDRPEIGRMFEVEAINFALQEVTIYTPSELQIAFKDCELMQFTGLTDKNGKEIYEGDILMYLAGSQSTMEVKFQEGCFVGEGPFLTRDLCDYFKAQDFESIEVIGNIFEATYEPVEESVR